jgi:hypothetical protein
MTLGRFATIRVLILALVAAGAMSMAGPALAQAKPADPKKPAAIAQDATPIAPVAPTPLEVPATTSAHVEGFRSAKFGMSEADVRAAIAKDFPDVAGSIKQITNAAERTKILLVKSADVLPDSGTAEVSYIFGYKSKALIQISIVWSKQTDEALTPETIVANGEGLRSYFLSNGFAPSAVVSNVALPDGVLLFRGTDADGREVLLVLKGTASGEGSAPKAFAATSTTVFYIAKTTNPDVFKIPAGKF